MSAERFTPTITSSQQITDSTLSQNRIDTNPKEGVLIGFGLAAAAMIFTFKGAYVVAGTGAGLSTYLIRKDFTEYKRHRRNRKANKPEEVKS